MLLAWVRETPCNETCAYQSTRIPSRLFIYTRNGNSCRGEETIRSWLPRNWTGHFNAIQISSFFSIKYSWILTLSNFIRSNFILFHLKYQIVQSKIARKRVDQRSRGISPPRIIGTLNFARLLFPRTRWIRLHLEMITRHVEIGFDIGRDVQQIVTLKINKHSRTSVDHRTTPYVTLHGHMYELESRSELRNDVNLIQPFAFVSIPRFFKKPSIRLD